MANAADQTREAPAGAPADRAWPKLLALALGAALIGVVFAVGLLARGRAGDALAAQAAAALPLATAPLAAVIEKQRLIPMILARDPEVSALLMEPTEARRIALDAKFQDIAEEAGASVLYLIDRDGVAIAASNDGGPGSFVGSDYGFRPYFYEAMARGTAQQYALGTVSGRPGLYLTRRVDGPEAPLGVVVVKVEFDELEARWRDGGLTVQVVDPAGVVLVTTDPAWRFGPTRPLADEVATRAALQLADRPLPVVPVRADDTGRTLIGTAPHFSASAEVGPAAPGWRIATFLPAEPAQGEAARRAQVVALLAGSLILLGGYTLARRRRWARTRREALSAMNAELEHRVTRRTEELNSTNAALAAEIAERETAENRVRLLRDDLAQANRLSILGQVAAGVAHEINQPVAAIRTYAESGARLLDAGHEADARENLREIVGVTDRIGAITQALRGFARRGKGELRPVAIEAAVDGALTLLAGRIRDAGATIIREPRQPEAMAVAGRIRLEQILVNLLGNALDALRDVPDPRVAISVVTRGATVAISVSDNGGGIPAEVRDQLFMPFNTTKEKGLGLGLVISGDLAREFGGVLRLEPGDGGETTFTLELPSAR